MRRYLHLLMGISLVATPGAAAYAQLHGGDITVRVFDNRIETGVSSGAFEPTRVFGAELGEIIPNEVDEPGFDSEVGTFPAGSSLTFSIMDSLRRWNGADFEMVPSESIGIRFGSSLGPIYTPATPMVVEGFSLNVAADGSWHRHYDFVLTPPATDGIYLLALSLSSSDPTIEPSKPFYVVFNQNEAESTHDASIAYVESSLVPEPHTCLLALGGLASCLAWVRRDRR